MERVLIISYIISMILMVGFIYCVYREKYWVFEFVNKIKKPIQQLVYVLLMLISSYAYICFSLLIEANFNAVICAVLLLLLIWAMDYLFSLCFKKSDLGISEKKRYIFMAYVGACISGFIIASRDASKLALEIPNITISVLIGAYVPFTLFLEDGKKGKVELRRMKEELKEKYPELNLVVLIGSVRNTSRINYVFETYHPDIVYHAAAHKHVPLMEDSPNEAVKNNVFGTWKTAMAAAQNHTKKFVMISTDKAVNPTNIMGASKRICEMIVQTFNRHYETEFVAVRFGNVLGSNGSVIPLFKKQIAAGGPVTVTHPDIIRYFMTIPEAVSLVLQAGAYAKGGEIFVLDMGEPVKILDLAKNLIRLSGYRVGEDIKIVFTGLRPGEKLYEELLMKEEGLQDTDNKLIHIGRPIELDERLFFQQLKQLEEASKEENKDIRPLIHEVVPTYHYQEKR